jgi:7-cyano-7-deazaguanine reductase
MELTTLTKTTEYRFSTPNKAMLETFATPWGVKEVKLEQLEFTSLCPVTGQPDYGKVEIHYSPKTYCLESKSLKLYLMAYRGEGAFCEALASRIAEDLLIVLRPYWISVDVIFNSRGGVIIQAKAYRDDY